MHALRLALAGPGGLLVLCAACLTGCSTGASLGIVRGKVTLGGKPVTGASVLFEDAASGVTLSAALADDGTYAVRTHRGAGLPPGSYKVAVTPGRVMAPGEEVPLAGKRAAAPANGPAVPPRYHRTATSGLTAEVRASDNPSFDFPLTP